MNPYTPQSRPHILAGRGRQLAKVQQLLNGTQLTGRAAEGGFVLYGVRGVGKTSLLRAVADQAEDAGFVTVWLSSAKRQATLPSLVPAIQTALEDFNVLAMKDKWFVESVQSSLNTGVVNLQATTKNKGALSPTWDVGGLERMFRVTTKKVVERKKAGLLLFIDELHTMDNDELAVLLNALQNIAHDRRRSLPFAFLGAGLPPVRGISTKAATFGERTEFAEIGTLSEEDTKIAIAQPAVSRGVGITTDAVDLLWNETGGYPYFVQLYGYHMWDQAQPNPGAVLSKADAIRGVASAREKVTNLFNSRFTSLSKQEKLFVVEIAKLGGDNPVRRIDIANALGKSSQGISTVRARLIDRAVITEERHGYFQFTIPGFAEYVLAQ